MKENDIIVRREMSTHPISFHVGVRDICVRGDNNYKMKEGRLFSCLYKKN